MFELEINHLMTAQQPSDLHCVPLRRYFTHEAAMDCLHLISGSKLDERTIRADWDTGFEEGRQFGR
jgi:hypothetical protein